MFLQRLFIVINECKHQALFTISMRSTLFSIDLDILMKKVILAKRFSQLFASDTMKNCSMLMKVTETSFIQRKQSDAFRLGFVVSRFQ